VKSSGCCGWCAILGRNVDALRPQPRRELLLKAQVYPVLYNDTSGRGNNNPKVYLRQLTMAREVIFEIEMASPAGVIVQCVHHPQKPAPREFNHAVLTHSLACLDSWPWRLE
jgi:hypothetical protein